MVQTVVDVSKQSLKRRNIFVDALAILFGMSSWIGVTSIFLQLPLIVDTAPEGWSLPSQIAFIVQCANIGSFAYVLIQKYSPKKINDGILIYFVLCLGCIGAICMAFFYEVTVDINGGQHSVALLICTLLFALVGCLSSVLFMPYMGRFRECYLVSYMLGFSLNGFVSSVMALIQGIGGPVQCIPDNSTGGETFKKYVPPPLFGTEIFFIFVFLVCVFAMVAFILLNNLDVCKKEYAPVTIGSGNEYHYDRNAESDERSEFIPEDVRNLSTWNYVFLMAADGGLNALGNGIFNGVISYASAPYGNMVYHLAVILGTIAGPCGGLIAMFVTHTSIRVIRFLTFVGVIVSAFIFFIATQSPTPPLQHMVIGSILIVAAWTMFHCIIGYMKTSIVSIFRYQEGRTLVWVGTVTQISSLIGSVISFVLVNYTRIFVAIDPCAR